MSKQEMQALYGRQIQKARKDQHMTREELADRVGISTTFCANLECGNKMMSVETLDKLSEALGVSTDYLMGKTSDNSRIQNIVLMLKDQPEEVIAFTEKVVRLCVNDLPREIESRKEADRHETGRESADRLAVL